MIWSELFWAFTPIATGKAGLLRSIALRWANSPQAVAYVPSERFLTGRIPNTGDYPFPFVSVIPGSGTTRYRSDKYEGLSRLISLHIFVDADKLEEGEKIAEIARRVYANQRWTYDAGQVIDVIDGGPPNAHQIEDATFQAWELVKLFSLRLEQSRVDVTICPSVGSSSESTLPSGSVSDSQSSSQSPSVMISHSE